MITPFSSIIAFDASTGAGTQSNALYEILPVVAATLGILCVASYIITRLLKRFI